MRKRASSRIIYDDLTGSRLQRETLPVTHETFLVFLEPSSLESQKIRSLSNLYLVRYSLGMPETSLSGRNTRIARNVRRSISRCMPCENAVRILPQKHTHPATLYYLLLYYTNAYATLKYLYYVH